MTQCFSNFKLYNIQSDFPYQNIFILSSNNSKTSEQFCLKTSSKSQPNSLFQMYVQKQLFFFHQVTWQLLYIGQFNLTFYSLFWHSINGYTNHNSQKLMNFHQEKSILSRLDKHDQLIWPFIRLSQQPIDGQIYPYCQMLLEFHQERNKLYKKYHYDHQSKKLFPITIKRFSTTQINSIDIDLKNLDFDKLHQAKLPPIKEVFQVQIFSKFQFIRSAFISNNILNALDSHIMNLLSFLVK
ncbi:unnamed protein product [Paramecium primaurelia]|uniref:Uncharacterized protein n=1 Tax=Paramecium primaurelia TaxID=5886 RepID=A0A8S1NIA7_PARPR|nr:unnamed protein product [Paramecium primaurelia]